jgi:hypothetical protein
MTRMHTAKRLGDVGDRIIESARARIGATVVKPDQLASAAIGLWLAPHEGEPRNECELAELVDRGDYAGAVQYDDRLPDEVKDRVIARACAAWLIEEAGEDASDGALVDYVATALCGAPKPLIRAEARALAGTVERVKARRRRR